MSDQWEKNLACATVCSRCSADMKPDDKRILSVFSHEPICMACKASEEKQADYEEASRQMIGQCMAETEVKWSDPGGYCFFHFYPFKCT